MVKEHAKLFDNTWLVNCFFIQEYRDYRIQIQRVYVKYVIIIESVLNFNRNVRCSLVNRNYPWNMGCMKTRFIIFKLCTNFINLFLHRYNLIKYLRIWGYVERGSYQDRVVKIVKFHLNHNHWQRESTRRLFIPSMRLLSIMHPRTHDYSEIQQSPQPRTDIYHALTSKQLGEEISEVLVRSYDKRSSTVSSVR